MTTYRKGGWTSSSTLDDCSVGAGWTKTSTVRSILLLWCVLAWLPMAVAQNDPGLRTGPTIDAYERLYFGLFPDIPTFDSARVALETDSSLTVTVARKGFSDTTLRIQHATARALRTVLATFETTTLDKVRHPLLRDGIMLPSTSWRDRDIALVVALADTSDRYHRVVGVVDSTALLEPVTVVRDSVRDALVIDMTADAPSPAPTQRTAVLSDIVAARRIRLASRWPGAIRGGLVGMAFAFPLFSQLFDDLDRRPANNPWSLATVSLYVSAATAFLPGLAAGTVLTSGSSDTRVPASVDAVRTTAEFRGMVTDQYPPTPEFHALAPPRLAEAADTLAARSFREAQQMHFLRTTPAVGGVHLGIDYGMHAFESRISSYNVPIGVHAHLAGTLTGRDAGPWMYRIGAGAGFPLYVYVEGAFVFSFSADAWIHGGLALEHLDQSASDGWELRESIVRQPEFGDNLFAGGGLGFRVGTRAALDITYRFSVPKLVIRGTPEESGLTEWSTSIDPDNPGRYHLHIVRITLSWRIVD